MLVTSLFMLVLHAFCFFCLIDRFFPVDDSILMALLLFGFILLLDLGQSRGHHTATIDQ